MIPVTDDRHRRGDVWLDLGNWACVAVTEFETMNLDGCSGLIWRQPTHVAHRASNYVRVLEIRSGFLRFVAKGRDVIFRVYVCQLAHGQGLTY